MVEGVVTEDFAAVIPVTLLVSDEELPFVATLDTGFDDYLSLPGSVVEALNLPYVARAEIVLADGSVVKSAYHQATVLWEGISRTVLVLIADNKPLVGMRFIADYEIRFVVRPGASIYIQKYDG